MTETERKSTLFRWLLPTMFGPGASAFGAVSLYAALGHDGFARWAIWLLGVLLATLWASVYALILVLVDVALLATRLRALPTGKRGWGMSVGSPLAVFAIYTAFPPARFYPYGPWGIVAAVLAPMVLMAVVTRVVAGRRP